MQQETETRFALTDQLASDYIQNFKTVATLANESKFVKDYEDSIYSATRNVVRNSQIVGMLYGMSQFMTFGVIGALFYAGAYFHIEYGGQASDIFIAIFSMVFGAMISGQAQQFGPDLGKARMAAQRVFSILDFKEKRKTVEPAVGDSQVAVEFRNVWFRYPTRSHQWVLQDFSLKIQKGESVGFIGESGCGKSTLTQLLLRFYEPNKGWIFFNGVEIRSIPLKELRKQLGYVMQEPALLNCSIKDNILYGNPSALNSQIFKASEQSNALEFIQNYSLPFSLAESETFSLIREYNILVLYEHQILREISSEQINQYKHYLKDKIGRITDDDERDKRPSCKKDIYLPVGFDLNCGVRGSFLSGGQKQRVAIARGLVRKPQLLIFDEATSALDETSQHLVQRNLKSLPATKILIAHRISTLTDCDRIIKLRNGKVEELRYFK